MSANVHGLVFAMCCT